MALIAKVCFLGDGKVGKTSLINQYLGKGFSSEYLPTLGSDFASKDIELESEYGHQEIRFQIWDLAGQPSFGSIRKAYYKGSIGALLVFDLTNPDSLMNLEQWINEFSNHSGVPNHTIIVLANKSDLKGEITISPPEIESYIRKNLLSDGKDAIERLRYFETSAKTGQNVNEAFESLGHAILKKLYS